MTPLKFTLTPQTAFATPLKGDTLFGQLCWAARHILGESRLSDLLQDYTDGKPYLVISDAFPAGYLPMPKLPREYWQLTSGELDPSARKKLKKRQWLPVAALAEPLAQWLEHHARADVMTLHSDSRPHNTINRATNTTGTGEFSPYTVEQTWYQAGQSLEVHALLDEARLTASELESLLHFVGASGFGRDASTGLGKFTLDGCSEGWNLPEINHVNAWLTLAPCAPQGLDWISTRCYYKPFTRFGRHGDVAAISGQPYKTPLLLADTAAILTPRHPGAGERFFTGQGLGGDGSLSNALPQTVHQGYAPVIGICLPS